MQSWLIFWSLIFWFTVFLFIINNNNFLTLLIFSEIVWITLYNITCYTGVLCDDLNLISTTFLLLALAGLEFVVGLLIINIFKNFNVNINFNENYKTNSLDNLSLKKTYLNKFIWTIKKK